MKRSWALLASLWVAGCSGNDAASGPAADAGGLDDAGSGNGGTSPEAAPFDATGPALPDAGDGDALLVDAPSDAAPVDITPSLLAPGSATLSGITTDDYVIYIDATGTLSAIHAEAGASPLSIVTQTGTTTLSIRGRVVFAFSNVDYTSGTGDLTVWTSTSGPHFVGTALIADGAFAATDDGANILYASGEGAGVEDIVVASSDLSRTQTLVAGAGQGSLTTCAPSFGFGGARAFVASCVTGSMAATLSRFDEGTELPVDGGAGDAGADAAADASADATADVDAGADAGPGWGETVIATSVQPVWAADATGQQVMYVTTGSEARISDGTTSFHVDNSVNGGTFTPDGTALLYTVGDQLRRTSLSSVNPLPIVTYGYNQRNAWSPDLSYVLYSTSVVYMPVEEQDLRLASTASLNTTPDILEAQTVANLASSSFTSDSEYVLYVTDLANGLGTLDIRATAGGPVRTLPSVVSASAAAGSRVIYTDNRSDTSLYPVTASVSVLDLAGAGAPQLLQTNVLGTGSFFVNGAGDHLVYVRSGIGPDAGADQDAIYLQAIP